MNKEAQELLRQAASMAAVTRFAGPEGERYLNRFVMICSAAILMNRGDDRVVPEPTDYLTWKVLWLEMTARGMQVAEGAQQMYKRHLAEFRAVADGFLSGRADAQQMAESSHKFVGALDLILHHPEEPSRQ
ncbi:MAG: hypothetical protein R6X12_09255 [bacterium]